MNEKLRIGDIMEFETGNKIQVERMLIQSFACKMSFNTIDSSYFNLYLLIIILQMF